MNTELQEMIRHEAEKKAIEATEGYCREDYHSHDCCCGAFEDGFEKGVNFVLSSPEIMEKSGWVKREDYENLREWWAKFGNQKMSIEAENERLREQIKQLQK